ncbi:bifunctional [glutamate--ammonia ligase]-adenylyl-L-tyrosine phosphorylase/[glutamate--ammonia-ligase] adenylyltransferase [Hydrogenophaga sp.]|uniref:bifunctional [glutamate--ammonia ligase]-adenylyl-L-tyrosine phosphorylase/[glutamate--ammonia-ligase] adenylyltransferase n=1 Tax=Hydrogenophaga sp. TaxID=1904254 RepID=UPI0026226ADF|nr:bifunctional [glutamate--ammonia ligase]-adenylyl-L-tyrosine phosphorylase/[glutamate--ammonia-ligase] adenylyltransferase [Hydrogenophaga sp.]MCW5654943.1 bifunctional [glutamate--ammonia ligase]-adenylyl-L-tyrosine phosphorylase/[glutamate--ammonia-ligase] adenylyltransferase [Hydrogenophaga sp.]
MTASHFTGSEAEVSGLSSNVNACPPLTPADRQADHSRFVQRIRRRYADALDCLPEGAPVRASMQACLDRLRERGLPVPAALRVLRQLVLERLVVLDCEQGAPLAVVTRAVTELAELALDEACARAFAELDERYGEPRRVGSDGRERRAQLWVIGMGKLGARELNVSSDIDLIYIYDQDGETAGNAEGRNRISNHEYFDKAVRHIYSTIGETTEHGNVFRVDLALRPNGNSGPSAVSLGALEEYFLVQGREWERFAWLKSRVIAPSASVRDGSANALRGTVLPFVFRRYLDYGVFDALRSLHRQIREHAAKRAAGNPGRANDVKLSRGGIREIEFTVQLLQVVRGGQFPELRTRPTLDALQRLCKAGLMPQATATALAQAYEFLRRVEHRIQYLDDQQTHVMPTRDDDLAWLAASLDYPDVCAFLHALDAHRELVAQEFDILLGGPTNVGCHGKGCNTRKGAAARSAVDDLQSVLAQLPPTFAAKVQQWCEHPRVLALREDTRARLVRLVQRTGAWLDEGRVSEEAALRMADWIEPLLRRESYLALLQERPSVHERLLRLLGAAKWPARYLLKHPGVIDELASQQLLNERFDAEQFESELQTRRASLRATGEDDEEALLNLMRRAHHAEVFRTLARDLEKVLTVEQVADDLSALADSVLRVTARWCWSRLKNRHRDEPSFAIIGYGKLGGKELGYGSDLDIVFVYEDEHENAAEIYAAFVRKMINWLTVKTGEGDLFEIDTALRPNGNSGLLVTSFNAYANYQQQRGSNTAWTWEHQAMTRARFVLGNAGLAGRFDAVREAVITAERDAALLAAEITAMRAKVRAAHPVRGERFDVKHSPGGMVDVEFAVQYLVLLHSRDHPELRANTGNINLLRRAEQAGLLTPGMGEAAARAYRELRQIQHRARLDETPTQVDPEVVAESAAAVRALWQHVLGRAEASPSVKPGA